MAHEEQPKQELAQDQMLEQLNGHIERLNQRVQTLEQELAQEKLERAREKQELSELASTDPLTKLPNRRGLAEMAKLVIPPARKEGMELRDPTKKRKLMAALQLDIDNFKIVNDLAGHPEGDRILREAADYLKHTFRATDIIARFGGEEFVVIFNNTTEQDIVNKLWDKDESKARLGFYTEFMGEQQYIGFSGGITTIQEDETIEDLESGILSRADAALYSAKEMGRDRIVPFSEGMLTPPKQA